MSASRIINMAGAFSIIPREVLENQALGCSAVRVLCWMVSHDEEWVIRISDLQKRLGFKRKRWVTARDQLVAARYLIIKKTKSANGRFEYTYYAYREPQAVTGFDE